MAGMATMPIVAATAVLVPAIAAMIAQQTNVAMANPPGIWETNLLIPPNNISPIFPLFMIMAIRMKSGMAAITKESRAEYIM
jgi:hypothetical protein